MLFPCRLTLALLYAPIPGIAMPHAATSQSVPPLSVEETAVLATAHANDTESSRGTTEAATQMAVTTGQLPNPIPKLGLNNVLANGPDRFSISRDSMTMRPISVMQEFARGDRCHAKTAHFEAETASAGTQRAVSLASMQHNAVGAWLDRQYIEQTDTLLGHHDRPLELASQATAIAYRSRRGTRADVLAMGLEVQELYDRLDENHTITATSTVALEHWIDPAANRPFSGPPHLGAPPPVERPVRGGLDAVPEVTAAQYEVGLAENETQTAAQAKKPDAIVELMYSQCGSAFSNMGSANVSFPLPWGQGNRQDREVAVRLVRARTAHARSEILRRDTQATVGAKLTELQRNLERLKHCDEETLPLASTQTEAALIARRANTGSLLAMAKVNHRTVDTELKRLTLEARTTEPWADLTFLVPLPTVQTESAVKERR